jgi:hypothetical protein
MQIEAEVIRKAVDWWADKLIACKNSGLSSEERSDPANRGYQMAEALMALTKPKVSQEQIDKFKNELTRVLENYKPHSLMVDYNPDGWLTQSLEAAGISSDMGVLPIKTRMHIEADKVEVSYGYGAEYVAI